MAQEVINVGIIPNDGSGDPIRTAYIKCNNNFSELYSREQTSPPPTLVGTIGDVAGMYAYDQDTFYWCFQDYDGSSEIWAQTSNETLTALENGSSNVTVAASANVAISVSGQPNVAVFSPTSAVLANAVVPGTLSVGGNATFANVLPSANLTYDLGSADLRWNSLYLAGNTIFLGNAEISTAGSDLVFLAPDGSEFSIGGGGPSAPASAMFGDVSATGNITATGSITAAQFIGDGQFLTNITVTSNVAVNQIANSTSILSIDGPGEPITFTVAAVSNVVVVDTTGITTTGAIAATGNISGNNISANALVTDSIEVTAGNITGITQFSASGNISAANLTAVNDVSADTLTCNSATMAGNVSINDLSVSGNILVGDLITVPRVSITDATDSTSITTGDLVVAGGVGVAGNITIGGNVTATANITANYLFGNGSQLDGIDATSIQDGTSSVSVIATNGNVRANVAGNTVATFASTGVTITGLIGASGNVTGANLTTGGVVTATGNVTGGNITTGGVVTATGNVTGANLATGGVVTATGNVTGGNIITAGIVSLSSITKTGSNGVGNIGSSSSSFNTVFAKSTSAQYADIAEKYQADQAYTVGTVVSFGGSHEVTESVIDHDCAIAGVISEHPSLLMNSALQDPNAVVVALLGRVRCKVTGSVRKGQMLVSAGHGQARAETDPRPGAIIGKSLEDFDGESGTIEIAVGRL